MENYNRAREVGHEPSADEPIDVLKNLENLAASNPALYRAIVDQIRCKKTNFYLEVFLSEKQNSHHIFLNNRWSQKYVNWYSFLFKTIYYIMVQSNKDTAR